MKIPESLNNLTEKDQKLNGIINTTLSQYGEILKENNLYFFEEYTDHGIKHIESVLNSTVNIIPEETLKLFFKDDSKSIPIYILAAVLHDIGMHITPEGFYNLISGENDDLRIEEIDHKTWKELWNDYLDEARRFGDNEKKNIIGNISWSFRIPEIDNKDKLTGEDKKLIGEFIRRHHPRIAHEISLKGFPTKDGYISFASELDYELRNLCGLLARSHGVPIRNLFNYLESKFDDTWTKPYNIEIIYLMTLLRIADYFQIDSDRTPDIIVKLKTFNSPISQIEHFKHLDVKYIQPNNKDPETLSIHCEPRDSYIFIKLKELFKDIQRELDISWAILGEIYGKEPKNKQPKIAFRRIKSSIDNTTDYSKKVNYIPERILFNVSNELPKLLIGPLYGNDPTFGVRELLQNAVDSCREREFLEKSGYKGKVIISILKEKEIYYFQIEDNGLGMNLNIIKNYFLEVGSSLRKSSIWRKNFSNIDGHSKIQRSGKFGIGVLASFLIGDEIYLETRDSNSSQGLSFCTNLNTEQIEITKIDKEFVGTKIRIQVTKDTLDRLKFSNPKFHEWYLQKNPIVQYVDETGSFDDLNVPYQTPGFNDSLPEHWRILEVENYNKIIWTYEPRLCENDYYTSTGQKSGKFIVNGILIPGVNSFDYRNVSLPFTSIFDFDGKLPLNLSRNTLDGDIPFKKEFLTAINKDILAKLLTTKVKFPSSIKDFRRQSFTHPAIGNIDYIFSKEGFILKDSFFAKKNSQKTFLHFFPNRDFENLEQLDWKDAFIYFSQKDDLAMSSYQYDANLNNYDTGAKLYLNKTMYDKLFDNNYNRYPIGVRRAHTTPNSSNNHIEVSYKYNNSSSFQLKELEKNLINCNCIIETRLIEMKHQRYLDENKIFETLLKKYFNENTLIPYDIKKRKEKFKLAFEELDYYIKKYNA
jgi:hypothetical protein